MRCNLCDGKGIFWAEHRWQRKCAPYSFRCPCLSAPEFSKGLPLWYEPLHRINYIPETDKTEFADAQRWARDNPLESEATQALLYDLFRAGNFKDDEFFQKCLKCHGKEKMTEFYLEWKIVNQTISNELVDKTDGSTQEYSGEATEGR
jgi:hypothetical protein